MVRRRRKAFTLVELLVVITIISMLMALLLPAVQAAREAARRAQCMNNQHQLALAVANFEGAKGRFPGYREILCTKNDGTTITVSWLVTLFPYMELSGLHGEWKDPSIPAPALRAIYLGNLVCPSDPPTSNAPEEAPLAYVASCGLGMDNPPSGSLPDPTFGDDDGAAHGVFHDRTLGTPLTGLRGTPVTLGIDYVSQHDGSTYTFLLSENVQAERWTDWAMAPVAMPIAPREWHVGFCWSKDAGIAGSGGTDPLPINVDVDGMDSVAAPSWHWARPSSRHPGGVIMSFCDGHQQFISEMIDWKIYKQAMTPWGKKAWYGSTNLGAGGILDPGRLQ